MEHFKPPYQLPEIVVYRQTGPNPLCGSEFVARFWQAGDFLPMIFSGSTQVAAKEAANQFWLCETAKIEARRVCASQLSNRRYRTTAANGDG